MLEKFDTIIDKIVQWLLVFIMMSVMIFSVLTIVIRWFSINWQWIEPFTRHMVFLSAFLGGAVATKKGTHIGIDVLGKFLESKNQHKLLRNIQRYIAIVSFVTLVWLAKASYDFMIVEKEFGTEAFFGLHSSTLVAIIPIGFGVIAYRFLYMFIQSFGKKV